MIRRLPHKGTLFLSFLLCAVLISQQRATAVAPDVPTEVAVVESTNTAYGDGQLTVTWKAVTNATGYAAVATKQGTTTPIVISTDGNSQTRALFTGLAGGSTYAVKVQALTGVEASAFSANISAVPKTLPKAPAKPTVVKGVGQATVTWTALTLAETGGFDVSSYVLTEINSKKTMSVNGTTTSTTMTGLSNGSAVEFTITAITAASSSGATSEKSDKYTLDDVPGTPSAPVVALTSTSGEVQATWSAPSTDGGSAIVSFTVKLFKDGVENATKLIDKITDTFHTFTSLLSGKYTAKVYATNGVGDSALSALSNEVEIGAAASPTPTTSATPTPTPTTSSTPTPTPTPTPTESTPTGGGSSGGGFFGGGGGGALPPAVVPMVTPSALPSPSISPSPTISASASASPTPSATSSISGGLPLPSPTTSIPKPTQTSSPNKPLPSPSTTLRATATPTALPSIKPNSYVAPVPISDTTKLIPISNTKTTSTVVQPNKSLAVSIPAVKAGTKVALTMKGPDGKTITIPTPKVTKSGTYKLPALQFKKPGTYTMTVKVGTTTKTIKVTVPKAK